MSTFLIAGGTGLVGNRLSKHLLQNGHRVIILSRKKNTPQSPDEMLGYAHWDVDRQLIAADVLATCDYIINLAGAPVMAKRWSKKYRRQIETSRVQSCKLLIAALRTQAHQVKALVCASGIGYYGYDTTTGKAFTETDPAGTSFLSRVCVQWEAAILQAATLVPSITVIRIGLVLSKDGGLMSPIQKALKWGIAAIPGNGTQIVSWIHIDDLCRMIVFAAQQNNISGVVNAVAPMPLNLKTLVKQYALSQRKKYICIYAAAFILRLLLGARAGEILNGTTASCTLIKNKGFSFLYPGMEAALSSAEFTNRD